jgi:hypothetical protein
MLATYGTPVTIFPERASRGVGPMVRSYSVGGESGRTNIARE